MSKCIIITFAWLLSFGALHAQSWDEWFKQKKTKIKYLVQQIATLETYAKYLEKGYHIAEQGLTAIGDIKNGEFDLHRDYFGSLTNVSPKIKNDIKVAEIIALQVSIVQQFEKMLSTSRASSQFNSGELGYFGNVYTNLVAACINDVDELISLTTDGKMQMTDDERMQRIDALYRDMQDKYSFTESFANDAAMLALQRTKEANDINTISRWMK